MSPSLALLLAVGAAYLAAHVLFDWLARRFLIVSGAEYLLLGFLLGPQVSNQLGDTLLVTLSPVITLAIGWIGTIVGTEFRLQRLIATPARAYRIAFAESTMTFLVAGALELVVFRWTFAAADARGALVAAVVLGAMAVSSSSVGIALVSRLYRGSNATIEQLSLSTSVNTLFATVVFGLLLAVIHPATPAGRPLTATEWAVVSVALGVVGGALFHVFLGETPDEDRLFIALAGGIVLVSGAASYMRLSALLASAFFGMVLVNTTRDPDELVQVLARVERPFFFVLLLFGGAMWRPSRYAWVAPVVLFLVVRALGKIGASRLAARMNGALDELGPHWGRALLGQGRVVLAISLGFLRQEELPYRNLVFTAAIASILLTEFLSARVARAVVAMPRPRPAAPAAEREPVVASEGR